MYVPKHIQVEFMLIVSILDVLFWVVGELLVILDLSVAVVVLLVLLVLVVLVR